MQEATTLAAKLEHQLLTKSAAVDGSSEWCDYVQGMSDAPKSWLYTTLRNARHRAKQKGIDCTLTIGQLRSVLLRSKGRCEVTGLRFTTVNDAGTRCRPFHHSIDRIKSSDGYTVDNVRVVCHAVNIAMSSWGDEVFAEIARGYVFNRYSVFHVPASSN